MSEKEAWEGAFDRLVARIARELAAMSVNTEKELKILRDRVRVLERSQSPFSECSLRERIQQLESGAETDDKHIADVCEENLQLKKELDQQKAYLEGVVNSREHVISIANQAHARIGELEAELKQAREVWGVEINEVMRKNKGLEEALVAANETADRNIKDRLVIENRLDFVKKDAQRFERELEKAEESARGEREVALSYRNECERLKRVLDEASKKLTAISALANPSSSPRSSPSSLDSLPSRHSTGVHDESLPRTHG